MTKKTFKPDIYKGFKIITTYHYDSKNNVKRTELNIEGPGFKKQLWFDEKKSKTFTLDYAKKRLVKENKIKQSTKKTAAKKSSSSTPRYVKSTLKPIMIKGLNVTVEYIKEKGKINMTNVYINSAKGKELTYIHQNRKLSKAEAEKWAKATIKEKYDEWFPSDKLKNINQAILNICGRYMKSDRERNFEGVSTYKSGNKKVFNIDIMTNDRGPRLDHGGGSNGDDWMSYEQTAKVKKPYLKKWNPIAKDIQAKLRKAGIVAPKVNIDYGEKGHIYLEITGNL